jgi:hypothetical protein
LGLNFESRRRVRSRVLMRFGKPIVAADYRRLYEDDRIEAVNELTSALQAALRSEIVDLEHSEYVDLAQDIERVYKGELLERDDLPIRPGSRFKRDRDVARGIAHALDFFYKRNPEVIWRLAHLMEEYRDKRHELRLKDELLRLERGPTVRGEVWRFVLMGLAGLPWALYGIAGNVLPYKLTAWLVNRFAPDLTKVHTYQLAIGAAVFLPWYLALLTVTFRRYGVLVAIALALTLPAAGLFAREYGRRMRKRRRYLRFAYLELLQGYRVQELRQRRRHLIRELDAALVEYSRELRSETIPAPNNGTGEAPPANREFPAEGKDRES